MRSMSTPIFLKPDFFATYPARIPPVNRRTEIRLSRPGDGQILTSEGQPPIPTRNP
jgi:hypothetical protein